MEVVTGVNLPMLMKLAHVRDQQDLREAASALKQSGQKRDCRGQRGSQKEMTQGLLIRRAGLADVATIWAIEGTASRPSPWSRWSFLAEE